MRGMARTLRAIYDFALQPPPADEMSDELKNRYAQASKSDRFFDQTTPVPLYRGLRKGGGETLMIPTLIGLKLKRGPRPPDVLLTDPKGKTPQYEDSDLTKALIHDESGELMRKVLANAGDYTVAGCRTLKGNHRGMSVFDKANTRLPFTWYRIPINTKIPKSLAVTRDEDWLPPARTPAEEEARDPVHYTIAPKDDMPLSLFLQHLKEMGADVQKI